MKNHRSDWYGRRRVEINGSRNNGGLTLRVPNTELSWGVVQVSD